MLNDSTVCFLGPMTWAAGVADEVCIPGNVNTVFALLTPAQTAELARCPKGRLWDTDPRQVSEFPVQTGANLGRLVESTPQKCQDMQKELDEAYAIGCDEFSSQSINAANRALQRLRDQHPTAWDTFVSRNMTVRTVLGLYQGTPTASAFGRFADRPPRCGDFRDALPRKLRQREPSVSGVGDGSARAA